MRKRTTLLILVLATFALCSAHSLTTHAATQPPAEGGVLPDIKLPAPEDPEAIQYLGVKGKEHFQIPQIRAEVVLVEVFSMYCPFCQREAPAVNELYKIIAGRPELKDKIKMIGIGAGNSPYEVNLFKNTYAIPFPLFADSDFSMHKTFGEVRTPHFIAVRIKPDGSHRVIYSKVGGFGDPHQFLDLILDKAKP